MDIDKILFKALLLDGNETCELSQDIYNYFKRLLIALTKIKYSIRYCTNENCPCHPESTIKELMKNYNLCEFLNDNKLFDCITNLVTDYKPIIADGIYND